MVVRHTLRFAWWTAALLIVALAVALSAARLLLPGMSDYRMQVESAAENFLKRPVQIGSLDAAWHGLSPVLKLKQVLVRDPQFPDGQLTIDEVDVALDVIDSLMHRQWLTAGIKLIGIRLNLETDLVKGDGNKGAPVLLDWLLRQESITLEDVQLDWLDPGLFKESVRFTGLSARLVNAGGHHQFLLETLLPQAVGETLKIAADLKRRDRASSWGGRIYLKTTKLELDAVTHLFTGLPVVASGKTDLELWGGIVDSRLQWGSGSFAVQEAMVKNTTPDAQGIDAQLLSSSFSLQATPSGWQFGLRGFELRRDERTVWPSADVNLRIATASELDIQGSATILVPEELHAWLPLLPWVDAEAMSMVDRLDPEGVLRDAEFELRFPEGMLPRFSGRATIEDMRFAAHAGLPGVSGLSGTIEGNLQSGYLHLDCTQAALSLPKVFPAALGFSHLQGTVRWQRYAERFRIESQLLSVATAGIGLQARWQLDWPYEQSSPWLDMQLAVDDFPLDQIAHHLPERVMPPRAVSWLKRAFVAGTATNTRLLMQGRPDQMPFDEQQGRFEARFDFEDVVLDYHPTWGQLDELDGSAVFVGRSMQVIGTSGRIDDSPLERVVAVIDDLKRPLLEVEGTVGGTLAGMLEFTSSSPLGGRFGSLIEQVDSVGDAGLQLDLSIPLVPALGRIKVNGRVTLEGNDLVPKNGDIGLTAMRGTVRFNQNGIRAKQVRANLLDQPVLASVYQQGEAGQSRTVVDIAGKLKFIELLHKENSLIAPYVSGATDWQVLLQIENQRRPGVPPVEFQLRSELKNVAIDLPEPFTKTAAEAKEFRISWVPGQPVNQPIRISYGDLADARVLLTADKRGVRRAGIRFDGEAGQTPRQDVIQLAGHLHELDLQRWISIFSAAPTGGHRAPPLTVDLSIDNFFLAGMQVKDIKVESSMPDPWYFLVQGEGAGGWARWVFPDKARPARVMAGLEHLVMNSREAGPDTSGARTAHPQTMPELDINVASLNWDARNLGRIKLVGKRSRQGVDFETLEMHAPAMVFKGHGRWVETNGQQSTGFDLAVKGGELGELTKLLGSGSAIKGGVLDGDIRINWPGSPADFALATFEADFNLRATDGRLVSVDEGGAGKLLSLFSLNSLQRRLTLDFSDVFKEGFSFDKMQGHFVVMDGDAFTDDFTIKGTSATIEIAGRTGLVAEDYDQLVTVIPQVSSTLPIAGAIAGGPVVGAAVYLADKLVGDQFNRITRIQYQVSGSWDDPVYARLGQKKQEESEHDRIDTDEP